MICTTNRSKGLNSNFAQKRYDNFWYSLSHKNACREYVSQITNINDKSQKTCFGNIHSVSHNWSVRAYVTHRTWYSGIHRFLSTSSRCSRAMSCDRLSNKLIALDVFSFIFNKCNHNSTIYSLIDL